jgi:DnaJ-class molecular chaperone
MGDNYKLYNILEVNKNASDDEIKSAYKKKAMQYHPDKNKGDADAANKFKELSNAYSILSDREKRNRYDHCGDNNYNESGGGNDEMRNHRDIFEAFFRGHEGGFPDNIFGFGSGGRAGRQERRQNKADSIESVFNLTLDDVYDGVKKDLNIKLKKYCTSCNTECPDCDGKGIIHRIQNMGIMQTIFQSQCNKCGGDGIIIQGKSGCKLCSGKGFFNKDVKATLIIPKGVNESYRTAFPELGEQPKVENIKPGDLIISIRIEEHPHFVRNGNDLHYKTDISFINSVVGTNITIPYFKENIEINTKIFGVISNGKKYMIEGKGLPILNTNNKGNMYIEFNISYPKIKNAEKIEELKKLLNDVFI